MTDTPSHPKTTVGWREIVALPDWDIPRVRAKIDTGARTSAIHVQHIEDLDNGNIRFEVVTSEKPTHKSVWVEATPSRQARVKPSSGIRQKRHVVETTMRIGTIERTIEISLVCRKGMLCRMLVGRTALADDILVNPAKKYLLSPKRKRTKTSPKESL